MKRTTLRRALLGLCLPFGLCAHVVRAQEGAEVKHEVIREGDSSEEKAKDAAFYPQRLTIPLSGGSILIKAPASVRPGALKSARRKLLGILQKADPEVIERVAGASLEIAIIPLQKKMTDLPEFRHTSGKRNAFNERYDTLRGATSFQSISGVRVHPIIAIGEDDILRILSTAQSALHHEFGHVMHLFGLSSDQQKEWESLYQDAKKRRLFEKKYAMVSVEEYFAELTQVFFDTSPYFCSPSQLARVHPNSYKFLSRVYEGGAKKK